MTFDVNKWLEEGRAHKDQLPEGVVLPEPEIDYEAYREALEAYFAPDKHFLVLDEDVRPTIRGLIAAWEHMPETKALRASQPNVDGWIAHTGDTCPPGLASKKVEVILRLDYGRPAQVRNWRYGRDWVWEAQGYGSDITHYRVVNED